MIATVVSVVLALALVAAARALARRDAGLVALADALGRVRDGDTRVRVRIGGPRSLREAVDELHRLVEGLASERDTAYQEQLLLGTVIEQAQQCTLLVDDEGRIRVANATARALLAGGELLVGRTMHEVIERSDPALREVMQAPDGLHVATLEGVTETFHLTRQAVRIRERPHRLWTLRRLGMDLARQEADAWKRAVRVMSHELNNSLAPISSMVHSGRLIAARPELAHRLDEVFAGVESRVAHLHAFLERYARFARLPAPRATEVEWDALLARVAVVIPFGLAAPVPTATVRVDATQLEQVLINLLKNAHESGSPPESVMVRIGATPTQHVLEVLDRGRGMSPEELERALLPFYSSKPRGSGVGLPLCREILEAHGGTLRIGLREGGGVAVTCAWPKDEARPADAVGAR